MMRTRCSLFVLVALLVVGVPSVVMAQPSNSVTAVTATGISFDTVRVGWTYSDATPSDTKGFTIRYEAVGETGTTYSFTAVNVKNVADASVRQYDLKGLKAGTRYLFSVRAYDDDGDGSTWFPANGTEGVAGTTDDPPEPGDVDDRDVTVTAGNMMLTVSWARHPTPGGTGVTITGYDIQYSTKADMSDPMSLSVGAVTSAVIANLTNGTMYYVQLKAKNSAGASSANWSRAVSGTPSSDATTPTPALPVFGAVALGAGLLAAGRARLRRRQALRAGLERRQLNR